MSAPTKVTSNGTLTLGLGTSTGVVDEKHTISAVLTTVFMVEELKITPKTREVETHDADEATIMTKDVDPQADVSLKGKTQLWASGSLMVQFPGTALTTTIGNGTLAVCNLAQTAAGCDFTVGTLKLSGADHTQKRLQTDIASDLKIRWLPYVV